MGGPYKTRYLVLEQREVVATGAGAITTKLPLEWREVATVPAHSSDQAIRQSGKHGVLVAVPERSWKPRKVTTEQKTVTKVEVA